MRSAVSIGLDHLITLPSDVHLLHLQTIPTGASHLKMNMQVLMVLKDLNHQVMYHQRDYEKKMITSDQVVASIVTTMALIHLDLKQLEARGVHHQLLIEISPT